MIVQRIRGLYSLLAVAQSLLLVVLYWAWFGLSILLLPQMGVVFLEQYFLYCAILVLGLVLEAATRKEGSLSAPAGNASLLKQFPVAFRQTVFSVGLVMLFLVVTKDLAISRIFLFSFTPVLGAMFLWSNTIVPLWLAKMIFKGSREGRTLLVGSAARARDLNPWLERKSQIGFLPVGLLTNDTDVSGVKIPVLGKPESLGEVLDRERATQIILLELPSGEDRAFVIDTALGRGARLLILSDLEQQLRHPVTHLEDDGWNFIAFHEEPLENPFNRLLKRGIDLALALPVVVFLLPPLAVLVWLLHRLQSPGPLFYNQIRAGIQNCEFTIMKFRTMHAGHGDETRQATPNDERVFAAGRWLRRFSLDEIPQFLNVLRGEMSVVGPRPHLAEHNRQFAQAMASYHIRTFVKPGITGLAQVRGFRGEARTPRDIQQRLQSDLLYLENWSVALELGIILRTIWQMIFPPKSAL